MLFKKTIGFFLALLAARIEAVDINRVWFDQNKVYKCRRWWGWVLILIGNPVLACRRVPVCVLFTNQWLRWEREVKRVYNQETIAPGRVLVCNQLPGVSLADWLAETRDAKDACLEVLKIAIDGLQEFHRLEVGDGRGGRIRLSHGDATLNNLLYDANTHTVEWLDFDLRHWLTVPAPRRHADDLRAFLFSAASYLSEDELPDFLSMLQQQYADDRVWDCLRDQLSSRWFRFDVFHQAQIRRIRSAKGPTGNLERKWIRLTNLIVSKDDRT